jgi:hypothetical protein
VVAEHGPIIFVTHFGGGPRSEKWDHVQVSIAPSGKSVAMQGRGTAEAPSHIISGLENVGGTHNNDSLLRTFGTATNFRFRHIFDFLC